MKNNPFGRKKASSKTISEETISQKNPFLTYEDEEQEAIHIEMDTLTKSAKEARKVRSTLEKNPFSILPKDMIVEIMSRLPNKKDLAAFGQTEKRHYQISKDPVLKKIFSSPPVDFEKLKQAMVQGTKDYLNTTFMFFSIHGEEGEKRAMIFQNYLQTANTEDGIILLALAILQLQTGENIPTAPKLRKKIWKSLTLNQDNVFNKKILSLIEATLHNKTLAVKTEQVIISCLEKIAKEKTLPKKLDFKFEEVIKALQYDLTKDNFYFSNKLKPVFHDFKMEDLADENSIAGKLFNELIAYVNEREQIKHEAYAQASYGW